jgi:hypothetical protein
MGGIACGESRSKLVKGLFVLSLSFSERLVGRERKWGRLHLLDTPESGKFGWFGAMVLLLAHGEV